MKRIPLKTACATVAAAVLSIALLSLCGCAQKTIGTSNNDKYAVFEQEDSVSFVPQKTDITASETGEEVHIDSSCWWAKDCYIHYGIKITNPNDNLIARDVVIRITGYDEAGAVLSQDEDTISFIGPASTTGFAGECGNGQKPANVEIEVVGTTTWQEATGYTEPLLIASIEEADKGYYRYEYTGGVTNNTGTYVSYAPISILLEDEQGNILAGYAGSTKRIKTGRTKDYQVTINTAPDHAQVEVFAQWSDANDSVNEELDENS